MRGDELKNQKATLRKIAKKRKVETYAKYVRNNTNDTT